jgi:hypothetical protein
VRREWEPEDLVACWTLVEADRELIANKSGATRVGFVRLLKYFELEGRFPRHAREIPKAAVGYVARQVGVPPDEFSEYDWTGRQVKRHRAQIRGEPALPAQDRSQSAARRSYPGWESYPGGPEPLVAPFGSNIRR